MQYSFLDTLPKDSGPHEQFQGPLFLPQGFLLRFQNNEDLIAWVVVF